MSRALAIAPSAAAAYAQLRAWVSVMLATLGRGAVRLNHARHSAQCGKPPGGAVAGWTGEQATQQWNGKGAPGDQDSVVDLFQGPGGVEAWAIATPTNEDLAAYTRTTTQAAAAAHPCPATPQTGQAIAIGGAPAQLLSMQCPPGSGFLVELAVTIHEGDAFVFASQNPSGTGNQSADRVAFRNFLASIGFQR